MIKVTLKDGIVKEFPAGITAEEITKTLGAELYKAACACEINGRVCDLRTPLTDDCALSILTFEQESGKKVFWHTASHILAQAVKRLYPAAKLAIGPAIDNGFYYDFDVEQPFSAEDIGKIENEMKRIVKENPPVTRFTLSPEEAREKMKDEPYKLELIDEHAADGDDISFYSQGDFTDLCAGPHLLFAGAVKALKLTQCTGAYWRADASNRQLCRVYGTAFPKAAQLEEYLTKVEEAKKRDHNIIGRQLGYFTTSETVGQGLPLFGPKGAKVLQILQRFIEDEEEKRGYQLTKTPYMAKSDLYKQSGHWAHYKDGMFLLGDEDSDDVMALRPMTCPFQFTIYNSAMHSYRELPIRYNETSTLFRNESSGEMHGLIRIRQFTLSEGHIIAMPEQLAQEFTGAVDLCKYIMDVIGLSEDIYYRFSLRDPDDKEKYVDDDDAWDNTEAKMRQILLDIGIPFTEALGEAAFYGPKLDLQMRNVHGKEDTLFTIQVDFCLAGRMGMTYIDADGEKKTPVVVHRSSIGCYERTLAMLLEKYAGALPLWLCPEQVRILPISERSREFAAGLLKSLTDAGIRASVDTRNEKIGYKIREAQLEKLPYMLIVGEKEMEAGLVSVRRRGDGDVGQQSPDEFISKVLGEIKEKNIF
ncbi:MAG TPA: threonine--tRNA ligase [Ruminococcaceae bacterium]|nr:threonine--tRNA ligase [Oscillospiraceae bacterium]